MASNGLRRPLTAFDVIIGIFLLEPKADPDFAQKLFECTFSFNGSLDWVQTSYRGHFQL